jgi:RHS repeat-associated protein
VRDVIDAQGYPQGALDYSPYGETTGEGTLPDFRYAGMFHLPETGLYLTRYRLYDPASARWLNRDPIGETGGINLYAYVEGNPVNAIDPTGKMSLSMGLIGATVVGVAIIINTPEGKKAIGDALTGMIETISNNANSNEAPPDEEDCPPSSAPPASSDNPPSNLPPIPENWDGTTPPASGWEWHGPDVPGGKRGGWVSPDGTESLYPDSNHPSHGPHVDWNTAGGGRWRIYPDGTVERKK